MVAFSPRGQHAARHRPAQRRQAACAAAPGGRTLAALSELRERIRMTVADRFSN